MEFEAIGAAPTGKGVFVVQLVPLGLGQKGVQHMPNLVDSSSTFMVLV